MVDIPYAKQRAQCGTGCVLHPLCNERFKSPSKEVLAWAEPMPEEAEGRDFPKYTLRNRERGQDLCQEMNQGYRRGGPHFLGGTQVQFQCGPRCSAEAQILQDVSTHSQGQSRTVIL